MKKVIITLSILSYGIVAHAGTLSDNLFNSFSGLPSGTATSRCIGQTPSANVYPYQYYNNFYNPVRYPSQFAYDNVNNQYYNNYPYGYNNYYRRPPLIINQTAPLQNNTATNSTIRNIGSNILYSLVNPGY